MSSSNVIERALTKSDLLVLNNQCFATKNGGTMKIYKARHMEWGPVVYKKLEDSVISGDDRLIRTAFQVVGVSNHACYFLVMRFQVKNAL